MLYSYPPASSEAAREGLTQMAPFCFPHGVQPVLLERTPSMSSLNELIYGQQYQNHDDHSFVFVMKVGMAVMKIFI